MASVPLNAEGTKVANAWDPATDGSCLAYGAAGLMRIPTRLNVTWQDDQTIKIETDAGQQTRMLRFDAGTPPAQRSLQGYSVAQWETPPAGRGGGAPQAPRFGNLKVTTTNLTAGWLRKNGVPYSENATVTEYYNRHDEPDGTSWFTVTTVVDDPRYLNQPFITSSSFKKETDTAKWNPTPCQTDPPR